MANKINVILNPDSKSTTLQSLTNIRQNMSYLVKLGNDERKSMQPIDDGRKPFVEKSIELGGRNATLDPGPGMMEAAAHDLEVFNFLSIFENELEQYLEMVRDTKQLAGAEAYEVARFVYMKAKMNVKMNVPGSQAIVDELGKLYKMSTSSAKPETVK